MRAASSTLANAAYGVVRRRILRGQLSLGQPVSRRKLANELGMSFLPVSEALLRLEFEGLLESRPRAGTRVRIPSPDDVRGHYLVRETLETQAAKLFSTVASRAERTGLQKMAVRLDALSRQANRGPYFSLRALPGVIVGDRADLRVVVDLVLCVAPTGVRSGTEAASRFGKGARQWLALAGGGCHAPARALELS
jgi:DNA-binding transcriptional regulator YhcF (GntR family)